MAEWADRLLTDGERLEITRNVIWAMIADTKEKEPHAKKDIAACEKARDMVSAYESKLDGGDV